MAVDSVEVADVDDATLRARRRLTTRLNAVVNRFAGRDDLLLGCLWRAPRDGEAPAWFDARASRVTINAVVGLQGANPGVVNPLTREGRRRHPEIVGLLAHEAAHAHSTDMSDAALEFRQGVHREDSWLLQVMTLLEEPRIEYRQVQRRPHDRYYLRAQSVMIDLAPFGVESSVGDGVLDRWRAATVALLVFGRVDAGILTSYDADHVHSLLVEALGGDDFDRLREVQHRAIRVADGDLEGLLACARQWLEVVGRPDEDSGSDELSELLAALFGCAGIDGSDTEGDAGGSGGTGGEGDEDEWANDPEEESSADGSAGDDGADGDSSQDEDDGGSGVLSALGDALKDFSAEVATEVADDVAEQEAETAAHAAGKQNARDRTAEAKQLTQQQKVAAAVFDPDKGSLPALKGTRAPTNEERRLARQVGTALKRAQFRERTSTRYASMTPPGRLNGRDAMLGEAQKSMGNIVTARPFHSKRKRHAPEPPITLGLLADYSGSMGWASDALSSVAWIFSHAMTYVTGTMASALFAEKVVPLTRPGERPTTVQEYAANGGWENFTRAYAAINGALNFTRGTGVRLLVVISDGHFVNTDAQDTKREALHELKRAGVKVLWVGIPNRTDFPDDATPVELPMSSPITNGNEALADVITTALTDAFKSLS